MVVKITNTDIGKHEVNLNEHCSRCAYCFFARTKKAALTTRCLYHIHKLNKRGNNLRNKITTKHEMNEQQN